MKIEQVHSFRRLVRKFKQCFKNATCFLERSHTAGFAASYLVAQRAGSPSVFAHPRPPLTPKVGFLESDKSSYDFAARRIKAVNYTCIGKPAPSLQTHELFPRDPTDTAMPRQQTSPDPCRSFQDCLESEEVAGGPITAVVARRPLLQGMVVNRDRLMRTAAVPVRQCLARANERAFRRLALAHPSHIPRLGPLVGEARKVECPRR